MPAKVRSLTSREPLQYTRSTYRQGGDWVLKQSLETGGGGRAWRPKCPPPWKSNGNTSVGLTVGAGREKPQGGRSLRAGEASGRAKLQGGRSLRVREASGRAKPQGERRLRAGEASGRAKPQGGRSFRAGEASG